MKEKIGFVKTIRIKMNYKKSWTSSVNTIKYKRSKFITKMKGGKNHEKDN